MTAKKKTARTKKAIEAKKKNVMERHKKALDIVSKNVGNPKKIKEELMALGYSESYIDSGQLKNTDSWNNLVEKYLPDEDLAQHHKDLLNAHVIDHITLPTSLNDEEIREMIEDKFGFKLMKIKHGEQANHAYFSIPNAKAKKEGLDMAYKLKKKYGDTTIVHKFGELSDEDIEAEVAGIISEALGLATGEEAEAGE